MQQNPQHYVGKTIIVGLTYLDAKGNLKHKSQLSGRITSVDPAKGIFIHLDEKNGEEDNLTLPPDMSSIQPAPPGEYRFRESGRVVTDPDYMTNWTITAPTTH